MSTDIVEFIKARRSIRVFQDEEIPDTDVVKILTSAVWAPSAGNVQPWHFYVVRSPGLKAQISASALDQNFIAQAPLVFVACADLNRAKAAYAARGERLYCIQDTAAAVQNMLLTIHALGLGACWVGAFSEDLVTAALRLPPFHRPVALVPVGKPAESPKNPGRRSLQEVYSEVD